MPHPEYLEGVSLSLVTLSSEGFYHFLHELIPRYFLAQSLLQIVDRVLVNGNPNSWQLSWLELAGVPASKITWMSGLSHYHCQQIIFTSNTVFAAQPNQWSIMALKEIFRVKTKQPGKRWIWASRSDASSRQIFWESQLTELFPQFELVCFSSMSPQDAINICSECEVFAGSHGAAFSNIVFCQHGVKVIEFFPLNHEYKPEYQRLASICKLLYTSVVADFAQEDGLSMVSDYIVRFLKN